MNIRLIFMNIRFMNIRWYDQERKMNIDCSGFGATVWLLVVSRL